MPEFHYRARDHNGYMEEGERTAVSAEVVAEQLLRSGLAPVEIHLYAATVEAKRAAPAQPLPFLHSGPTDADMSLFARQMYALTKAGVPILRGLDQLANTTRNVWLARALRGVATDLEAGRPLTEALAQYPRIFPALLINMVQVGEEAGRLEEAFLRIYEYLESDRKTVKQIKAALRYPSFVLLAMACSIVIMMIYVIPAFAGLFSQFKLELPLPTRIIMGVSNFMVTWWWALLMGLGGVVGGFMLIVSTRPGRYRWDWLKLHFPAVGSIIFRASLSRFARAFSVALRSGVPLIQALTVVAQAIDNAFLEQKILAMRQGIARGDSITQTATAMGVFTPLVLQMLAVGDETGQVDDMMREVADFYQGEVDYDVRRLGEIIEPLLMVVMGVLVLVLALGVFLPMWDMVRIVGR
ncbi:MAG: biosis protein MshG [Pseudomonadota bacterium]|nr:biosis protein MshG [Pseudomonadota bacterium]